MTNKQPDQKKTTEEPQPLITFDDLAETSADKMPRRKVKALKDMIMPDESLVPQNDSKLHSRRYAGLKPWQPGQSGNPAGSVKHGPMFTPVMRRMINEISDDGKTTWLVRIILAMFRKAVKGDPRAGIMVLERLDGKVVTSVELSTSDGLKVPVSIEFILPGQAVKELPEGEATQDVGVEEGRDK